MKCPRCNHDIDIVVEKAGELWRQGDGDEDHNYYHTFEDDGVIKFRGEHIHDVSDWPRMIHNKNGWTRLYPPVEDESIERIEIEAGNWKHLKCEDGHCSYSVDLSDMQEKSLMGKPLMKMILEIPKEK
jgi:hypothetical protein